MLPIAQTFGAVSVVLVAFAVFTGSAAAAPGGDALVVQDPIQLGANSLDAGVATCPGGTRVVGGGVGTTGDTADADTSIHASGPLDETGTTASTVDGDVARSWYAAVWNGSNAARDYKVFALCSASSDATIEVTTLHNDVDGFERLDPFYGPYGFYAAGDAAATCPDGKRVVGGGIGTTSDPFRTSVLMSGPLDETGSTANTVDGDVARSWYASVFWYLPKYQPYPGDYELPPDYEVFALCSSTSDATIAETTFRVNQDRGDRDEALQCPSGSRALGGGVGSTGAAASYEELGGYASLSGPLDQSGLTANTDDGDIARMWFARVGYGDPDRDFKLLVLCATDELRTLSASRTGTGTGTVTSSPSGIECGATCSASIAYGERLILTATAAPGSSFAGWSGDCTGTGPCAVTMSQARSVTAIFTVAPPDPPEDPPETESGSGEIPQDVPDTEAELPDTTITNATVKRADRTARFKFKATDASGDVSFECKLTGQSDKLERWRPCSSPRSYQGLKDGEHVFAVRATTDEATDPTAARKRFRI
jgi:hypothetical protein